MRKVLVASACLTIMLVTFTCQNINIDDDGVLVAPTSLTATASGTDVELEWANSTGAISYTVYYAKDSATVSVGAFDGEQESILQNSVTIGPLDAGYTYAFIVVALGAGGITSPPSSVATAAVTGAIAAPVFSLAEGIYIGSQNVVIERSRINIEDPDTIVYTTNGTEPTRTNGTELTTEYVTLTDSATLKAFEYRPSWSPETDSPVISAEYTIADLYTLGVNGPSYHINGPAGTLWSTSLVTGNVINAEFTAMKVVGTHVYVAGSAEVLKADLTTRVRAACLWNNDGTTIRLDTTDGTSRSYAIDVDPSGNVFIAGSTGPINSEAATTWKWAVSGGTITTTALVNAGNSRANAIFVSGVTVYAAGFDYQDNATVNVPNKVACYWIGSSRTLIGDTVAPSIASVVTAVAYDGTRVMAAGYAEGVAYLTAKYWQSGSEYDPAGSGTFSQVLSGGYAGGSFIMTGYKQASGEKARAWSLSPSTPSSIQELDLHPAAAISSNAHSFGFDSLGNLWYGGYTYVGPDLKACVWANTTPMYPGWLMTFNDILGIHATIR